jgi:hypothetical protein
VGSGQVVVEWVSTVVGKAWRVDGSILTYVDQGELGRGQRLENRTGSRKDGAGVNNRNS